MSESYKLSGLVSHLNGSLAGVDASFDSVSIDTRTLKPGALYVSIKGENFDGHDFVAAAHRAGASGAIVSREIDCEIPQLVVADTLKALGALGQLSRRACSATVVGITGSQGKTTVKEMVGSILSEAGTTLVTRGNLNNAIGVPLTLLQLQNKHRYAVIEMGANRIGEIGYSVNLVKPDVAIITNAARAHIEGFGSLEGVCIGKGEIIDGLSTDGTMVLNRDDRFFPDWLSRAGKKRVVSFSLANKDADYFASDTRHDQDGRQVFWLHTPSDSVSLSLSLLGMHNVGNAIAAAAVAMESGVGADAVRAGLDRIVPVKGRLCPVPAAQGGVLIDDSYNASPDSFNAAIDVLATMSDRKVLLVGDMAELGATTDSAHRELGSYARAAGVDELWTIGDASRLSSLAFGDGGRHFQDKNSVVEICRDKLGPGVVLLVKGSRSAGLDEVVRELSLDQG